VHHGDRLLLGDQRIDHNAGAQPGHEARRHQLQPRARQRRLRQPRPVDERRRRREHQAVDVAAARVAVARALAGAHEGDAVGIHEALLAADVIDERARERDDDLRLRLVELGGRLAREPLAAQPLGANGRGLEQALAGDPDHGPSLAQADRLARVDTSALDAVQKTIRAHLPRGYEEIANGKMTVWQVPLSIYPDTYNKEPLMYAALAARKSHMAVYLCNVYGMPELRKKLEAGFKAAGKKLDMGASCIRFKKLEDLPLDVIAEAIAATPMQAYIEHAKKLRAKSR
jgi:hypothetical protein